MSLLKRYRFLVAAVIGGFIGYFYYLTIGCANGKCLISSNPLNSTLYGILIGLLLPINFKKPSKK